MACLGISSLRGLLPAWVKWFLATPSNSDRPYTSSSRNTSLLEERSDSPVSHKSSVHSPTGYVRGITVLPSPPPAYPFTTSKSAVHGVIDVYEYQGCEPFSFNRIPPIPRDKTRSFEDNMEQLPALHEPPIIFSPTSDMHAADQPIKNGLYYRIKRLLKYYGVRYTPFSARYLWLYVQYHDSSTGYVGFSTLFFNANVSLQQQLVPTRIVATDDWEWLQEKHGFKIGSASK